MSSIQTVEIHSKTYQRLQQNPLDEMLISETHETRHLLSLFLSLILWGIILFCTFAVIFWGNSDINFLKEDLFPFVIWAFFAVYLLYAIELFTSSTFDTLWDLKDIKEVIAYIELIKNTNPELKIECTPYNFFDKFDSKFSTQKRFEFANNFYKRVFQFEKIFGESKSARFDECFVEDRSDEIGRISTNFSIIEWTFSYSISFSDDEARERFNNWKETFCQKVSLKDIHYDAFEQHNLGLFVRNMSSFGYKKKPFAANWIIFSLLSLLVLVSWPYRLWFDDLICRKNKTFRKVFTLKSNQELNI